MDDTREMWKLCNCPEFERNFSRSITYYDYAIWGLVSLVLLQLTPSIILCCRKPRTPVTPVTSAPSAPSASP
jgi:hypothetical protein